MKKLSVCALTHNVLLDWKENLIKGGENVEITPFLPYVVKVSVWNINNASYESRIVF